MVPRRRTTSAARASRTSGLDEVKRTLRRLIEVNAGIPAAEVDDDASVDSELAMDSMSFLALQVAVEEAFAINCTPDEILAANRFAAIAALVHDRVSRPGNGGAPPSAGARHAARGNTTPPRPRTSTTAPSRPRR